MIITANKFYQPFFYGLNNRERSYTYTGGFSILPKEVRRFIRLEGMRKDNVFSFVINRDGKTGVLTVLGHNPNFINNAYSRELVIAPNQVEYYEKQENWICTLKGQNSWSVILEN